MNAASPPRWAPQSPHRRFGLRPGNAVGAGPLRTAAAPAPSKSPHPVGDRGRHPQRSVRLTGARASVIALPLSGAATTGGVGTALGPVATEPHPRGGSGDALNQHGLLKVFLQRST